MALVRKTARIISLDRSAKYFPRVPGVVFDVEGVIYTELEVFFAHVFQGVGDRGIDTNEFFYHLKKYKKELYFWDGLILIPIYLGIICADAANIRPAFMEAYKDFYNNVYKTSDPIYGCHFGTRDIVEFIFNLKRVGYHEDFLNFTQIQSKRLATAEVTPFTPKFNWSLELYSIKRRISERIQNIIDEIKDFFWDITHPEEQT